MTIAYFVSKYREKEEEEETGHEMKLIKSMLLSQSPLYGMNMPILWIHTKYELNARKWKSFYSRNSMDLNLPYIHLTVRTIIHHSGDNFHICLIDDKTFSKIVPSWKIDMENLPEPMKARARTLGFAQLLYHYGGMIVPNSFVCLQNLLPLFEQSTNNGQPFMIETANDTALQMNNRNLRFIPNTTFMGVKHKHHETIHELIELLQRQLQDQHFQMEDEFLGTLSNWCYTCISENRLNLVNGKYVGTKNKEDGLILLEDLFSSESLLIDDTAFGIFIPNETLLSRLKYKWFAYLTQEEILEASSTISIANYIAKSLFGTEHTSGKSLPPSHHL